MFFTVIFHCCFFFPPFSFNRIDLPLYKSYEKLLEKLTFAIEHTAGFYVE